MRATATLACAALVGALGCESREAKCEQARSAASAAWDGYVAALDEARARAAREQSESHALGSASEAKLSPAARQIADARYDRSSQAWVRAHEAALHDLCSKEADCRQHKERNARAQATLRDLDERLPLARAAAVATHSWSDQLDGVVAAPIVHPEYPALKAAQQLTRTASQLCAGVTLAR